MSKVGEYYRELAEFGFNPIDIKPKKREKPKPKKKYNKKKYGKKYKTA